MTTGSKKGTHGRGGEPRGRAAADRTARHEATEEALGQMVAGRDPAEVIAEARAAMDAMTCSAATEGGELVRGITPAAIDGGASIARAQRLVGLTLGQVAALLSWPDERVQYALAHDGERVHRGVEIIGAEECKDEPMGTTVTALRS